METMNTHFEEYFYHDVILLSVKYEYNNKNLDPKILFLLEDFYDHKIRKCVFENAEESLFNMSHNFTGNVSIMQADISQNDNYLLEYRERMKKYYKNSYIEDITESIKRLETLKCYIIHTNFGCIKIISSEEDIRVVETLSSKEKTTTNKSGWVRYIKRILR